MTNKAADRLKRAGLGARVRLTACAIERGVRGRSHQSSVGVIVGFGPHGWTVQVKPDGRKTATEYYAGFWEPVRHKRAT